MFFLRLARQKKARAAMRAMPTTGPTTAPAINPALLFFFFGSGSGRPVGTTVASAGPRSTADEVSVISAGDEEGVDAIVYLFSNYIFLR